MKVTGKTPEEWMRGGQSPSTFKLKLALKADVGVKEVFNTSS